MQMNWPGRQKDNENKNWKQKTKSKGGNEWEGGSYVLCSGDPSGEVGPGPSLAVMFDFIVFFQTSPETKNANAIQKGADFVRAFTLGFDVDVSI